VGDALSTVELRRATLDDAELLYDWRNDPETRRNSFSSDEIPFDVHVEWLRNKLAEPNCRLFIAELDGAPVAQVRVDRRGEDWAEVSVGVASEARGLGLGRTVIGAGSAAGAEQLGVTRVVARIKPENLASVAAFHAAGYVPRPGREDDSALTFEWRV
jgi:UDP-2,4-diacetamido-2,4,6-trideoxy-beta-L-altropyranose hydrolase